MYTGSLDIMSKAGHLPFQIFFMQKKPKKTSKFDWMLDDTRIEKIISATISAC